VPSKTKQGALFSLRTPVAEIRSGDIAPVGSPKRLQAIQRWAIANMRGQRVRSAALSADVTINRRGLEKATSRAGDDVRSAIPAIPKLLEHGVVVGGPEPPRNANEARSTRAWHALAGTVRIDGRNMPFVAHVREDLHGHYFYNIGHYKEGSGIDLQKGGETGPEGTAVRSPMGSMPADNLGASGQKSKIGLAEATPEGYEPRINYALRDDRQPAEREKSVSNLSLDVRNIRIAFAGCEGRSQRFQAGLRTNKPSQAIPGSVQEMPLPSTPGSPRSPSEPRPRPCPKAPASGSMVSRWRNWSAHRFHRRPGRTAAPAR
jgi:hypothetical protein